MPRQARGEYVNPNEVQILHLVNRCVRRAYLCGDDPVSGQSFEHRREWIRQRLEFLAGVFAIDCLTYTIMSNHLHLILRSRPDVAKEWSDEQVARRWLRLFPKRREKDGSPADPEDFEISMITGDKKRLAEIRLLSKKGTPNVRLDELLACPLDSACLFSWRQEKHAQTGAW